MQQTTAGALVLVVEDEVDMARVLEFNLANMGHRAALAGSGQVARDWLCGHSPDLILLDMRLPDAFGLDLLAEIRATPESAGVPIIIVSALGDEETVVQALNRGAEDYITKPFRTRELLARVSAALRRHAGPQQNLDLPLTFGPISVDPSTRRATASGEPVDLTRTEFDLVRHFCTHPDRVFTRKQLCDDPLQVSGAVQERTIDAHIRTIRRKLGAAGALLVTVWGVGYKLVAEE